MASKPVKTPGMPESAAEPVPTLPDASVTAQMPNAVDVDPHKITVPVLTRQGWICPAADIRPPNRG